MDGLDFITSKPATPGDPARADIACFIGCTGRPVPRPPPLLPSRPAGPADDPRPDLASERARLAACLRSLQWDGPDLPALATLVPPHLVPSPDSPNSFVKWLAKIGWRPAGSAERPDVARANEVFKAALGCWF